jgi:methionyl-tRNA formyltransferase
MEIKHKKIVIWCDGSPNQKALAVKIYQKFPVAGIIVDKKMSITKKRPLKKIPFLVWDRVRFNSVYSPWKKMQEYFEKLFPKWPDVPILTVSSINSKEAEMFTRKLNPDLIVVSGTELIKKPMLEIPVTIGIVNLHTGLSPYVKGGPNCTYWCIANNDWHLIGSTIMWINAGIDSGNIITSETIDIRKADNLLEAHKTVMEHAHQLYIGAIGYLITHSPPYQSIPQATLGKGHLFLTKMWTVDKRKQLLKNWKIKIKRESQNLPVCIPLPV